MNETLFKNSILKKTIKNREALNATPSSNKSVRFQGVEFMVITDEASERGSYIDEDMSAEGTSRLIDDNLKSSSFYSGLPSNTRINLFRMNDDSMKNTTIRGSCLHPPFQSRIARDLSGSSSKWSQAFTKYSSLKPPAYPKIRTHNQRTYISSGGSNASQRSNGSIIATQTSSLITNKNRPMSSSTNDSNNSSSQIHKSTSLTQLTGSSHPLTTNQAPQSLSLYSYLLQTKSKTNDIDRINPSVIRSQTKKITCEELNVKPFMPRIKSHTYTNTTSASLNTPGTLRLSHSSPTLKDYFHTPSEPKILNSRSSPRNLVNSQKKGGIIHVNTQNLNYLNTDSNLNDTNKDDFKLKAESLLVYGTAPSTKTEQVNVVVNIV